MGTAPKFGKSRSLSSAGNKPKREKLILLGAAGVSLLIALIIILVVIGSPSKEIQTASASEESDSTSLKDVNTVALLAPESEVQPGTRLSEVRLRTVQWPKDQIPDGAFTNPGEIAKLFAKVRLPAGIPIQRRVTSTESEQPKINSMPLTPGNRAVSIEVDDTSGLEGHALPGTRVDVVLTYNQAGNLVSTIIVQNARVLSYGGDTTPLAAIEREHRIAKVMRTMTLDVATQDALKIQTARQMGRLSLILRAPDDDAATTSVQFTGQDLQTEKAAKKAPVIASACTRGKMKIGGRQYVIECDGNMTLVE